MKTSRSAVGLLASVLLLAGCGTDSGGSGPSDSGSPSGEVTVWDYYGEATPLKSAIAEFSKSHPDITVKYEAFDYETIHDKFSVAVSSGEAPDLATVDMTWIPSFASNGLLSDLEPLGHGDLNGEPMDAQYTEGANQAMRYDGKLVTALYDFDAYALYYRKDILEQKGITVPTTWDELLTASAAMAERPSPGAEVERYGLMVQPDTFHYAQLLFQNGGSLLDEDEKKAAFNGPEGVKALDYMHSLLTQGGGLYWPDGGNVVAGIKSEQVGMFLNGPYMMGQLKAAVPEQEGQWAVAPAPVGKQQGSYLGGTGLVVPTGAKNPTAAWELAQFLLQPEQQAHVFTDAGAAPATSAALELPALSEADPYFGGQAPFGIFKDAMSTATSFPYVAAWGEIDPAVTDAVTAVLLGKSASKDALDEAADTADAALAD
jgi:multiple sugar transport system substrate-binding protein